MSDNIDEPDSLIIAHFIATKCATNDAVVCAGEKNFP